VDAFFLGLKVPADAVPPSLMDLVGADGETLTVTLDPTIIEPPPCDPVTQTCLP
jgi:hypothetical protein